MPYLCKHGAAFAVSCQPNGEVVAQLMPPIMLEQGNEKTLDEEFSWYDQTEDLGKGLFRVVRKVVNCSSVNRRLQLIVQARTLFAPKRYLIPCVMYNGNQWGSRNSPKGLTYHGESWVFAYDRTGIPSCTLTENERMGFALFASAQNQESLRSSCSLCKDGEMFLHRIVYPVMEAPVSYSGKNTMTERYDEYLTLAPGEQFVCTFYMFACVPEWENYACAALLDRIPEVFPYRHEPVLPPQRVWELGIAYLEQLIHQYEGRTLMIAGMDTHLSRLQSGHMGAHITSEEMMALMKKPEYNTYGFNRVIYEIGWAGQGFLSTRLLMMDALHKGNEERVALLVDSLENWVEKQRENGMVLPHFERYKAYEEAVCRGLEEKVNDPCQGYFPDVCNLGWGASEMSKIYTLLQEHGREQPELLRFATRICDFFIAQFNEERGFGKLWTLDGLPVDDCGTAGGFIMMGLMDTYKVTGRSDYLECARKALDFYFHRDLDQFICTAGAIDCQSVDKETAYPFVVTSLDFYELTHDPLYLTRAQKAAYYFFSWAFQYDALYPEDSDFTVYGYYTSGGTAISAEHHAIDPWGALLCPEFIRLAKYTEDDRWQLRARMMWNNSLYGINDHEGGKVHGMVRPLGSQNEGFFQARWTKYRPHCEERGHFNDWLVAWVSCWRLTALDRLTSVAGEKDWQLFA